MSHKVLLCLAFILATVLASPPKSLRFVSLVYRHGDRSPIEIYPKDIHQVSNTWKDGLGWLTNIGKMQQYKLGQFLKDRYDGFLDTSRYNREEIYVESSAENRCLMSAYCNLAGLFPPLADQLWNADLEWQPIPVQTRPKVNDNRLAQNEPCPRYDQLFDELINTPAVKEEEERNKEFYEMVVENTGIKKESILDIWMVADALVCEKAHNLTWNKWVYAPGVWDKLNELTRYSFGLLFNTSEMARLKGGPLLKQIISNMKEATKTEEPMPKVHMYSAHDTTVASLLRAMHSFDKHQPIYRALVMVELHEIDSEFVVKIFYRNDTTSKPAELIPKGCSSSSCTLKEFIKVTKDTVPKNWTKECRVEKQSKSDSHSVSPASWIALGVAVGLCLNIVAAVVIFVVRLRRRKDDNSYLRLQS